MTTSFTSFNLPPSVIGSKRDFEILQLLEKGVTQSQIAKQMGISRQRIFQILRKFKLAGYSIPKKKEEEIILEEGKLCLKDIREITGLEKQNIRNLIYQGDFPKPIDKISNLKGSPLHIWDKDEVMNWCEQRIEVVKQELLKRLSNNRDFLQLNSLSTPFEEMKWKGKLKKMKEHQDRYKP